MKPTETRRLHLMLVRRLLRGITAVVVLYGFAGCARFHSQPLVPSKTAADLQIRSLSDLGLKAFMENNRRGPLSEWPLAAWDFTNLTLAAFYYHPDLDVARAQWAVAKGGNVTAAERPNPTLNVTPGYNTTTPIPSPWMPLGFLDIPLETAGKRGYRVTQAAHLSEAARLNIATMAWQVRSRLRSRLLELFAAHETEALLKEQQALQTENLRLLERQYEAGAISSFELTQAKIAADSTRFALRDAERQSAEARVQLADAIGLSVSALESIDISFDGLSQPPGEASLADLRRQALLNRSDILGALAEYAASESALQLEIAKQYPDVHLSPGYQFDQADNKWSVGLTVTLPVLNQNQGAIAEAQGKRAETAARFSALQARILATIDLAFVAVRVTRQKQSDADGLLANLRKQEKTARAMFDAGEISKSELAGLRLQLSASALARLDATIKSQQALGLLEDALQSPLGLSATAWQTAPRVSEFSK